ncbi:Cardiolipin synthase [Symmachiella macrocystis]|uniref:Cardiolipin synthase n=1 Tax=Symmachiella macrocystis TaxID=2527985 RepID=A0A5C6BMT4_9PLAN|nr:cardiolipin synthase [Symmachiella macrocystis]TWU11834.1 Cardiolipin synthase [Symmachiella macrocystis]
MTDTYFVTIFGTGLLFLIHVAVGARAILRPHRDPASRVAWIVVIFTLPVIGIIAYLLLGETNIGRRRVARMREVLSQMPNVSAAAATENTSLQPEIPECYAHLFRIGSTVNGFEPVSGNRGELMQDSNATIKSMIADIDAAKDHVHLIFYIWLTDNNGRAVVEALKRAAARGVTCRAMADGLGSRTMIDSEHWKAMQAAGVRVAVALPIGNPLLRPLKGRIDLRNHRKILVIDNRVTYCGSQNCADPEFRVKAKYAPWVDAMIRFEGPIVRQNQYLFASDWMAHVDEDINDLLRQPLPPLEDGLAAQVIGTGPTVRYEAMPQVFETLMYAGRHELVISTPYYVPDEAMQAALCASARRGVETTIIFPAKNDSFIVGAASRSYYADLLAAGVQIFEYEGGLLHTKSLTLDGEITLIGSANMDRRSFDLNYENNILFYDQGLTADVRQRQATYLAHSHPVTAEMVANWPIRHRLWNNTIAMLGPVL